MLRLQRSGYHDHHHQYWGGMFPLPEQNTLFRGVGVRTPGPNRPKSSLLTLFRCASSRKLSGIGLWLKSRSGSGIGSAACTLLVDEYPVLRYVDTVIFCTVSLREPPSLCVCKQIFNVEHARFERWNWTRRTSGLQTLELV